jgi:hypothetical protein
MATTLPKKDLDETNILDITVEKPGLFEKFFLSKARPSSQFSVGSNFI